LYTATEGLDDEVADNPPIILKHPRSIGIKNPRHPFRFSKEEKKESSKRKVQDEKKDLCLES
jgi:hypothetical protein